MKHIRILAVLLTVLLVSIGFSACNQVSNPADTDASLAKIDAFTNLVSNQTPEIVLALEKHIEKNAFEIWAGHVDEASADMLVKYNAMQNSSDLSEILAIATEMRGVLTVLLEEGRTIDQSLLTDSEKQVLSEGITVLESYLTQLDTAINPGV